MVKSWRRRGEEGVENRGEKDRIIAGEEIDQWQTCEGWKLIKSFKIKKGKF